MNTNAPRRNVAWLAGGAAVIVAVVSVVTLVLLRGPQDAGAVVEDPTASPTALPSTFAPEDGAYDVESDICPPPSDGPVADLLGSGADATAEDMIEQPDSFVSQCRLESDSGELTLRAEVHGSRIPAAGVWETVTATARASRPFDELDDTVGDFEAALVFRAAPGYDGDRDELGAIAHRDNLFVSVRYGAEASVSGDTDASAVTEIATALDSALRK